MVGTWQLVYKYRPLTTHEEGQTRQKWSQNLCIAPWWLAAVYVRITLVLITCLMDENVTIESWAMLTVECELDIASQLPDQSWLQMTSPAPGGNTCVQDILASFLYRRKKWSCYIHLYLCAMVYNMRPLTSKRQGWWVGWGSSSELRWGINDQSGDLMSTLPFIKGLRAVIRLING